MFRLLALLASLVTIAGLAHAADDARQITWDDLVPAMEPMANPLDAFGEDVLEDVLYIERIRLDMKMGFIALDSEEAQQARVLEDKLRERGVEMSVVQDKITAFDTELERRNALMNKDLDGLVVRLPGYALPLEMSDTGVREFLLVPYVGACIHTPPPPPNQMIFVQLADAFTVQSLYDPVWITGQIRVQPSSRSLSFVDGQADVQTGYTLDGILVEPYQ